MREEPLAKLLAEDGSRSLFACNEAVFRRLSWPWVAFPPIFHSLGMPAPPLSRLPCDGRSLARDYVTNRISCATVSARTSDIRCQSTLS